MEPKKPQKPEKAFIDEKTNTLHGPECPRTKLEFGQEGGGPCPGDTASPIDFDRPFAIAMVGLRPVGGPADAEPAHTNSGPAQVATAAYREGFDRIFGTKATVGQA